MKTPIAVMVLLASSVMIAQSLAADGGEARASKIFAGRQTGNWREWLKVESVTNSFGAVMTRTNVSCVELGTGMSYWDGGQWAASDARFEAAAAGFAAQRIQHKVSLSGNLNQVGAVKVTTPDGIKLRSTPIGIGLYDAVSGRSLVIGETMDCQGELVDSNRVVYANAFNGLCADVIYTIQAHSFEQDIVFRGRLNPADYGFPTNTTRIQVYTEFYGNPPEPEVTRHPLRVEQDKGRRSRMVSPDLMDQSLVFGGLFLGPGQAMSFGQLMNDPAAPGAPVGKEYLTTTEGRTVLIESVEYNSIAKDMMNLPDCEGQSVPQQEGAAKENKAVGYAQLPSPIRPGLDRAAVLKPKTGITLAALKSRPGVVVDYRATIGSPVPTVFQGDTTYLVTGPVTCDSATTIEGGAVFKFKPDACILFNGPYGGSLTCKTTSYRPAIFTAVDDDSVGETMAYYPDSGYTGTINPAGYANPAVQFYYYGYYPGSPVLDNVRFRYCKQAVGIVGAFGTSLTIKNSQLIDCIQGVYMLGCGIGCGSSSLALSSDNLLFSGVQTPLTYVGYYDGFCQATMRHWTVDGASQVIATSGNYLNCAFSNCVIANSLAPYSFPNGGYNITISGSKNGFYNCGFTFGSQTVPPSGNPFQTGAGGYYYLAPEHSFRNAGTTSLPATLLNDLKSRATDPPTVVANQTLSSAIPFRPVVQRDTDIPDLGYHYDPLDYVFSNVTLNSTITLADGVAIGIYGASPISGCAIDAQSGAGIVSAGLPQKMNRIVSCQNVQEQQGTTPRGGFISLAGSSAWNRSFQFRFTDFSIGQGYSSDLVFGGGTATAQFQSLTLQDCRLRAVSIGGYQQPLYGDMLIGLTNNLLERCDVGVQYGYFNGYYPLSFNAYNNLFWNGSLTVYLNLYGQDNFPFWNVRDNLFDGTPQNISVDTYGDSHLYRSNNGFTGTTRTLIGANDKTGFGVGYQSGLLGTYYQSTSVLINAGSRSAADAGLFHHTMRTSNLKEGTDTSTPLGVVDIGFHYVAVDSNTNPLDFDGDNIPDYLEDKGGNGSVDFGETDWMDYYNGVLPNLTKTSGDNQSGPLNAFLSQALTVRVTTPGGTPLANAPVTFSMTTGLNQLASLLNGPLSTSLPLRSDANGYASAWVFLPASASENNDVTLTAQSGASSVQVTFAARADKVATPIINPSGGTFSTMRDVTISCSTPGATIYYTLNGKTPTESDSSVVSGQSISVLGTARLIAKAFKPNSLSAEQTADFFIAGAISAGKNHSLALMYDGSVWAAGENASGQLGDNLLVDHTTLAPVSGLGAGCGVVAVQAGANHSLALLSDGTVRAWGENAYGQIGNNVTGTDQKVPIAVTGLSGVKAIAGGANHSVALMADGTVKAWGLNTQGQVGDGTLTSPRKLPVTVLNLSTVTAISVGDNHTLALLTDGTVRAWGDNISGQLGDSTYNNDRSQFVTVSGLGSVSAVAAGGLHSLALLTDGTVRAWGENSTANQLGDGTAIDRYTPVPVTIAPGVNLSGVKAISAGLNHSLALLNDGTVYAWGDNTKGQLGEGSIVDRSRAVPVSGLTDVIAITAGSLHSLALKSDGSVWIWGYTNYGLASVTANYSTIPVRREDAVWMTAPPVVDTDRDGLPDEWEMAHFGNLSQGPQGDPDNDGLTNLQEYKLDLDPTVNQSAESGSRRNYIYDRLDRLDNVTGNGQVDITLDKEGNITNVTP